MTDAEASLRRVAAFDFDGTISRRDTLLGFLVEVGGRATVASALARSAVDLLAGLRDDVRRDAAKADVLRRVLGGQRLANVEAAGRRYAEKVSPTFRPSTLDELRRHREQGHETVIVSASLVYYLRPIAESIGVDHVIAVEMEIDDSGVLTGALVSPNVRGEQKAVRLREWLAATGDAPAGDGVDVELWAYGDSSGDEALLAMADHPTWIGRRAARSR